MALEVWVTQTCEEGKEMIQETWAKRNPFHLDDSTTGEASQQDVLEPLK